jgi:hypothetical protein
MSLFLDISSLSTENFSHGTKNNNLLPHYMNINIDSLSLDQENIIFEMDEVNELNKNEDTLNNDKLENKNTCSPELEKYKQKRIQKYQEISDYLKMVEKNRQDIKNLEDIIYEICDHKWEYDYSGCGPHDGPDKVCSNCNLYRR